MTARRLRDAAESALAAGRRLDADPRDVLAALDEVEARKTRLHLSGATAHYVGRRVTSRPAVLRFEDAGPKRTGEVFKIARRVRATFRGERFQDVRLSERYHLVGYEIYDVSNGNAIGALPQDGLPMSRATHEGFAFGTLSPGSMIQLTLRAVQDADGFSCEIGGAVLYEEVRGDLDEVYNAGGEGAP